MSTATLPEATYTTGAEVENSSHFATLKTELRTATDNTRSRFHRLKEFLTLRLGPGRLSYDEYVGLRLYDNGMYDRVDKEAFVGFKVSQKIWLQANYRFDVFGLVNNKIASDLLFAAYGFPIMPTIAIFRNQVGRHVPYLLHNDEELRDFLAEAAHYPLFGKPVSEHQSIGTASIDRYDATCGSLVSTTGTRFSLDAFVSYVKAHSSSGYLFQKRVSPPATVREICGERLATVRLLTIVTSGEPKLLRACWKFPAGANVADNFWRPGNLLAQLDLETGCVLRVVRRNGANFEEITHHPDSGVPMIGTVVPNWDEVTQLALEGAKVLEEMPLIGWDIAPVDSGAVIVELNETPDFKLHQVADRRGIVDTTLMKFLAERKRHAAVWSQRVKQHHLGVA